MDKYLYAETRIMMAKRAKVLGIFAIATGIFLFAFPFIAIILAAFAILFAFLSKGYYPKLDKDAKFGMTAGIVILSVFLLLGGFGIYMYSTNNEFRETLYTQIDEQYGDSYEEIMGMKPSEVIKEMLPGGVSNE